MSAARPGRVTIVKPASSMQSEINTPRVDVMVVLIPLFIVMALMMVTPAAMGELWLQLPGPDDSAAEVGPSPGIVRLMADGTLQFQGETLRDEEYVPRLRAFLSTRHHYWQRAMLFDPDPRAPYQRFIFALDGARLAGAEALGLSVDTR
ncbi:biopolymer transporter ExbD [Myxococcaceae bacterium JPH2]|nr:biopolymer transporter ExbD [Myxococcaceae bacterium JPH2]